MEQHTIRHQSTLFSRIRNRLTCTSCYLGTMNADLVDTADCFPFKKLFHGMALVALQLNDTPVFGILNHCPITTKLLFQGSNHFLQVKGLVQPLNRRHALPPVTLLVPDMNKVSRRAAGTTCLGGVIGKRVRDTEVLNVE